MNETALAAVQFEFGSSDLMNSIPLLWITGYGVAVLVIDLFLWNRSSKRMLGWFTILGLAFGLILNILTGAPGGTVFSEAYVVDSFTFYANLVILVSLLFTTLSSIDHLSNSDMLQGEYYGLLLLAASGMMLMVGANGLIIFFLGFEIMSLAAYILVGWEKSSLVSGEGALKYVVTGAFTSAVLIYGITLVMAAANGVSFADLSTALAEGSAGTDPLFLSGAALIAGSFTYKIAAIPFHMWAPDAYRGAPTPITGFVSTGVKAAAFLGFLRVLIAVGGSESIGLTSALALIAGITVIGGNIAAIAYRDLKGMLAYSSIAHAGYILIGVTALLTGRAPTISQGAVLFYLIAYTFMNLGAFGCVIYVESGEGEALNLSDFKGLVQYHPWIACVFALFLISLTGIPLTAGFTGKVLIFHSAIQAGFLGLAIAGAIGTLISIYYYMRVVVMMFMREPEGAFELSFSPSLSVLLLLTAWGILHLGISPFWLMDLANRSMQMMS